MKKLKNLLKKRQLILATLVLALGAAVFVNWYYSRPEVAVDGQPVQANVLAADTRQQEEHLGDSQYVHNPYQASVGEYFAGAKLRRSAAHDEAKETLVTVIADNKADAKAVADAGKALQTFTASTIDGAANCYLALRTGIIARNAYAYGAKQEKRPSRAAVFREAGAMLYAMSGGMVERVAATVADCLAGTARSAGDKTIQAGRLLVEGLGQSAGKFAAGTVSAVQGTGKGIVLAGSHTVKTVGSAIRLRMENTLGTLSKIFKGKNDSP